MTEHPPRSDTLPAGDPVGGPTASAAVPDPSPPTSPGLCATWPQEYTDPTGRLWVLDGGFDCYRHDEPDGGTFLRTKEALRDLYGLGVLQREVPSVGNVFEWAWEHSRAEGLARNVLLNLAWLDITDTEPATWPGYLHLWFHTDDDETGITTGTPFTEADLEPIADAVTELVALEELHLDCTTIHEVRPDGGPVFPDSVDLSRECLDVTYTLPAYLRWLTEHEVAW